MSTPLPTASEILTAAREVASRGYYGSPWIAHVAERLGLTVAQLAPALEAMSREGSIRLRRFDLVPFRLEDKGAACRASEVKLSVSTYHLVDLS